MLPYDVARCGGNPARLECDDCQRRTPGHPERQVYLGFWELEEPCPYRIPHEVPTLPQGRRVQGSRVETNR